MNKNRKRQEVICKNCGHQGISEKKVPGNILSSMIILVFAIMLGLISDWLFILGILIFIASGIYSYENTVMVCEKCKSKDIIPVDTPEGQKLVNKN